MGPNDINALKLNTIFTHLKLCVATATHNFKSVKMLYLFTLGPNFCKSFCLNSHFVPDNSDLIS